LTLGGVETIPMIVGNEVKNISIIEHNPRGISSKASWSPPTSPWPVPCAKKNCLSIRRIVRTPKRWDRIQAIAAQLGTKLPKAPDPNRSTISSPLKNWPRPNTSPNSPSAF